MDDTGLAAALLWGINWLRSQVLSCALQLLTDDTGLTASTKLCLSLLTAPSAETPYSFNFTVDPRLFWAGSRAHSLAQPPAGQPKFKGRE